MPATKRINPKSTGTIKFAASSAGLAAGTDVTCQVTNFAVVPSANTTRSPATFSEAATDVPGASSWKIEFGLLQDWGAAVSVSKYMFDNDGAEVWFQYAPADATVDSFKGPVYMLASAFGGKPDAPWEGSVSLPCVTKPTLVAHA